MKYDASSPAEFLVEAQERYNDAYEGDYINRDEAYDDLVFIAGEQWPEEIKSARNAAGRPTMVDNRLPQYTRRIKDSVRKLNPSIKILPSDKESDKPTADLYEGLIRYIQHHSGGPVVYERPTETAIDCGMSAWRVLTEYVEGDVFEQDIRIEPIHDPFAVLWDPRAKHPTRKDARFCFVIHRIAKEQFKKDYPDASPNDFDARDLTSFVRPSGDSDHILIVEYWYKVERQATYAKLTDGRTVELKDGDRDAYGAARLLAVDFDGEPITRTAPVDDIYHCKLSGSDVLEEPRVWPGRHIPIVAVTGEEIHMGDRVHRTGVIRYAKDPQRMLNYLRSTLTEVTALQPKAPYIVELGQVQGDGLTAIWKNANTANSTILPYRHVEGVAPPQRAAPPMPAAGLLSEIQLAEASIMSTIGIYEANLGAKSNETSGVAIRNRQTEGEAANSIYADNMVMSIEHTGTILVDLIPHIYDTERTVMILGEDAKEKVETLNRAEKQNGEVVRVNDLSVGRYKVRISTGPSYATQRQEARDYLLDMAQKVPGVAEVAPDLIAKNSDFPEAERMATRLKKMLDPKLLDEDEREEMAQPSPEEQQQAQEVAELTKRAAMAETAEKEASAAKAMAEARLAKARVDETAAKAEQTSADADKKRVEAAKEALELAASNGQLNAIIQALVADQVRQILQSPPQPAPPMEPPQPAPEAGFSLPEERML